MTEQEKNRLAQGAGWSDDRYTDKVKEGVRKELGMVIEDEVAYLRKVIAKILSDLTELKSRVMGEEVSGESVTDFIIYNANVEQIKIKAKNDIE